MKTIKILFALALFITLTACGSTSNSPSNTSNNNGISNNISAPTTPLTMKAAIYQGDLPSGRLTMTVDTTGTTVSGTYSVKTATGSLVSAGSVMGTTSSFSLGSNNASCMETMTFIPKNTTADSADISITGQNCSGQPVTGTTRIVKSTATSTIASKVTVQGVHTITISASSSDNINFVGTVTLNNPNLSAPATATITGVTTAFFNGFPSSSNPIKAINAGGTGFSFKVTNFSGHYLSATDNMSITGGYVRFKVGEAMTSAEGKYFIDNIKVSMKNNTPTAISWTDGSIEGIPYNPPRIIEFYTPL